jgi:methanethiol S-methyltransferase
LVYLLKLFASVKQSNNKFTSQKVLAMQYLILVLLWVLFYFLHTSLASLNIKRKIKGWVGEKYKWYRLAYTVLSTVFIFGILIYSSTLAEIEILRKTAMTTYLGYMLASFGTIIIVKAYKYFSKSRFIGIDPHDDLIEDEAFVTSGLHAYVRHPIYSGTALVFFGYFFFNPTLSSLLHVAMLLLYLPIGIHFEEKKLIEIYGEKYRQYKSKVSSLIPLKKIRSK